jgi:hypothetical protein
MPERIGVILLVFTCILPGCYERQEGCLDPDAINYDVSADINANCQYPNVSISVAHNWGDSVFSYDTTYLDLNGEPFQIKFMGFFLRDFEVEVNDSLIPISNKKNEVRLQDGTFIQYPEEIVFVEVRNFDATIDSLTVYDAWSALNVEIGLAELSSVDSASLNNGHPLNERNSMSPSNSTIYYDYVISILPDTSDLDSQRWIYTSLEESIELVFAKQGLFEPARNADLIFDLYYDRIFEDFETGMTDEAIRMMWEENISSAIELR